MDYYPYVSDPAKWTQHYFDVINGKIPSGQEFYVVDTVKAKTIHQPQRNVTPCDTQQIVDQAKAKLERAKVIKGSQAKKTTIKKTSKVIKRRKKSATKGKTSTTKTHRKVTKHTRKRKTTKTPSKPTKKYSTKKTPVTTKHTLTSRKTLNKSLKKVTAF